MVDSCFGIENMSMELYFLKLESSAKIKIGRLKIQEDYHLNNFSFLMLSQIKCWQPNRNKGWQRYERLRYEWAKKWLTLTNMWPVYVYIYCNINFIYESFLWSKSRTSEFRISLLKQRKFYVGLLMWLQLYTKIKSRVNPSKWYYPNTSAGLRRWFI